MGHQVTVYEMLPKLGGMLRYGIPNYRLPKNHLEEDTDAHLETGIQVHYNVKIGEDIKLDELRKVYDAVLITVALLQIRSLAFQMKMQRVLLLLWISLET